MGLTSFQTGPVFSVPLFVEIRKRLSKQGAQPLNDLVLDQASRLRLIKHRAKPKKKDSDQQEDQGPTDSKQEVEKEPSPAVKPESNKADNEPIKNRGTLMVDATVSTQNIGYQTYIFLLHEAR